MTSAARCLRHPAMHRIALSLRGMTFGFMTVALWGCGGDPQEPTVLEAARSDSNGVTVITLSTSLNELSGRPTGMVALAPSWILGTAGPGFTDVADVTTFGDTVAVLDRNDGAIHLFRSDGQAVERRIGKRGGGPGELMIPWGMERVGQWFVVAQGVEGGNTLTMFSPEDGSAVAVSPPVAGDWGQYLFRGPNVNLDVPTNAGIEDWARRLAPFDDSTLAVLVREKEGVAEGGEALAPHAVHVIRVRLPLPGMVVDTLATLSAPPVELWRPAAGRRPAVFREPLYGPRPLWSVGDDWYALAEGDVPEVRVFRKDGEPFAVIRWPRADVPISKEDQLTAAAFTATYSIRSSEEVRRQLEGMSDAQREDANRLFLPLLSFAEAAPQITALYGAGECLWMSGFNPRDFLDGTSLTWVGMNVHTGQLFPPVRIPGTDVRVRHFDRHAVYTKEFTAEDVQTVVRYPFPAVEC